MTAADLIARSISRNEIVTVDWTAALAVDLLVECTDGTEANGVREFWGSVDGSDWRVHLTLPVVTDAVRRG